MRIGIAASQLEESSTWKGATYEIAELARAAKDTDVEAAPIPLGQLNFEFTRGSPPTILLPARPFPTIDVLIVRRTGPFLERAHLLTQIMENAGVAVMDPVARFELGGASKLLSTASRHQRGVGSTTIIVFDSEGLQGLLPRLKALLHGSGLIAKPMTGAHGQGFVQIHDTRAAQRLIKRMDGPLLLQPLERIVAEYRMMLLDRVPLGMARKELTSSGPANAAQGTMFASAEEFERAELLDFVLKSELPMGLVGVDVARTPSSLVIIEENFAPEWKELDRALGKHVAEQIISRMCG